ncbi:hypothetical protein MMC12_007931 [Toensbergia leucococca]|nr:hypothetical protein [Toensbergia leucococca]
MTSETFTPLRGHCACQAVKYEVLAPFICVQCCHCTQCQRETGAAFALNAIVETSNVHIISSSNQQPLRTEIVDQPSGAIGMMARCPVCYTGLFRDYDGDGTIMTFVKAGTLDDESKKSVRPTGHIFTSTKLDWIDLTGERERGVPVVQERYKRREVWSDEANARYDVLLRKEAAAKKAKAARKEV